MWRGHETLALFGLCQIDQGRKLSPSSPSPITTHPSHPSPPPDPADLTSSLFDIFAGASHDYRSEHGVLLQPILRSPHSTVASGMSPRKVGGQNQDQVQLSIEWLPCQAEPMVGQRTFRFIFRCTSSRSISCLISAVVRFYLLLGLLWNALQLRLPFPSCIWARTGSAAEVGTLRSRVMLDHVSSIDQYCLTLRCAQASLMRKVNCIKTA